MGIFFRDPTEDVAFLLDVCKAGTDDWNERFTEKSGFSIEVKEGAVEAISRLGGKILMPDDRDSAFPDGPNAFKRAAAWMVSFCIHPLLVVIQGSERGGNRHKIYGDAARPFVAEFVVEALPIILSALDTQRDEGSWIPLDGWKGFLTSRFKNDLVTFFLWRRDSSFRLDETGGSYDWAALESTVLLLSLVLEASYGAII